jgi:hypothetical protein
MIEPPEQAAPKPVPTARQRLATIVVALLMVAALIALLPKEQDRRSPEPSQRAQIQDQATRAPENPGDPPQIQQEGGKPVYCGGPGAYRLSECGMTEKQAIEAEAAAAAAGSRKPNYDAIDAAFRLMSQKARQICDSHPISKMTMEDIEDCNKPMMRLLRGRQP